MYSLLESKAEIANAQRTLEATFRREFKKRAVKNIGYPGNTTENAEVCTDGRFWFWSSDRAGANDPNPRRLNWFGLLEDKSALEISVEINTPFENRNDQVAGFFARDSNSGQIYLFHSGRVGGGRKGVGKDAFLAWLNQPLAEVVDSTGRRRVGLLVMPVRGKAATHPAARYIDAVARFKQQVRTGQINTPEFRRKAKRLQDFYAESRGRRRGRRSSEIDYVSRHGDVVDAIHVWRRARLVPKGARFVKDVLIDLGVELDGELVEIYEAKTSSGRSDLYSAVGQVMVHGRAANCERVIVVPHDEPIASDIEKALKSLDIQLLKCKLNEKNAVIL
jgi:hypothetical protein